MKPVLADAHIHLFDGGYRASFTARPGVQIHEAECYASLAAQHGVEAALVVGYTAESWAANNNTYLETMVERYPWVKPVAFVDPDRLPPLNELDRLRGSGFVGVSMYLTDPRVRDSLVKVPAEWWQWIESHRWVVSINTRGADWTVVEPVLRAHAELRVLCSHLGLPLRVGREPTGEEAKQNMSAVLSLARFPNVHVKLSGFYALTDPAHDYPHRNAWPYVRLLCDTFGTRRLLWGSDYPPSLDFITFPQTFGHFALMDWLTESDRGQILGLNLLKLLSRE